MCWNDIGRIRLNVLRARLVCSYFAKAKPCGPDFTHQNRIQVNTCHLLLSSFVCFHFQVEVNSLAFAVRNFHPYSSEFVSQHAAAAVWLKAAISLQQKSNTEKKRKQIRYQKDKTNRKWQDSWKWAASGKERVWLTNDEAKSDISDHCTSLDAQPSRLCKQRRAQGKLMEPDSRNRLCNNRERRWFFGTVNALAKKARPYSDFK